MSSGWELELIEWGDGTTRLSFWDSLHGEDRIFILKPDGTAEEEVTIGDRDEVQSVNLVTELLGLLKWLNDR